MRLKEERKKEKEEKSILRGLRWKKEISCYIGVNSILGIIKLEGLWLFRWKLSATLNK